MQASLEQIEERLNQLIAPKDLLSDAIRYALLGPGKRIRPLLVLASAETFGITLADALDPACAIEMIHAFSLIHDDLPCMDNDDFRRGKKSLHRAFPEAIALLAGDALLSEAFFVLSQIKLPPSIALNLIETLSARVGKEGMTGGQALDMHPIGCDLEALFAMESKKTGDLFSAALEFGAILAGKQEERETMRQIGRRLGLAYQLQDDLFDANQQSDELKPTPLSILGEEKTTALLKNTLSLIYDSLKELPGRGAPIANTIAPHFKTGAKNCFYKSLS